VRQAASNMRLFFAGSSLLLPETSDAWRERASHTIVERYGLSETCRTGDIGLIDRSHPLSPPPAPETAP
jgi:acyl-CoA synthetase (AMP-forming)/AMP-acid ligase II